MRTVLLATCFAWACGGGGSGGGAVDGDKTLVELTGDEIQNLCNEIVEELPPRTVDCGSGGTLTFGDGGITECVSDFEMLQTNKPTCPVTVDQYRACTDAIVQATDAELCAGLPPECGVFLNDACA